MEAKMNFANQESRLLMRSIYPFSSYDTLMSELNNKLSYRKTPFVVSFSRQPRGFEVKFTSSQTETGDESLLCNVRTIFNDFPDKSVDLVIHYKDM